MARQDGTDRAIGGTVPLGLAWQLLVVTESGHSAKGDIGQSPKVDIGTMQQNRAPVAI